jgi:hypothetical protein
MQKIKELQMQMCPPLDDDAEAIRGHVLVVLFHLSTYGRNERVRLTAAELLLMLAEKSQAMEKATLSEQATLLTGLRRLYRQAAALGDAETLPTRREGDEMAGRERG